MLRGLLAAAAAAITLWASPGPMPACDAPVSVLARSENWARRPYTLLLAYQPGLADPKAFQKTVDESALTAKEDDSPIAALNLSAWTMDITGPVGWDYQDVLDGSDIKAYPMLAVLDAAGKPLAKFQSLVEARVRLAPAAAGEIVSYSMRKIDLKGKPARLVILYDSKASLDLDSPIAATQPVENRSAFIVGAAGKVPRVPTLQLAQRWVGELAKDPLLGLNKADVLDVRQQGQPGEDPALKALAPKLLPVCVLVDAMNRTIATFDTLPTKEQLRRIAYSAARDEIIKTLNADNSNMCLLSVHGTDKKANAKADAAIAQAVKLAGKGGDKVKVIDIDGSDAREEYLLRQFEYRLGQAEPMVVPVFGQGKILEPVSPDKKGEMDSALILDAIGFVFNNGCRDMPVGFDLLLGASDALPAVARKWTPTSQPAPAGEAEE